MCPLILRTNAIPVYGFLCLIEHLRGESEAPIGNRILDCGAGGRIPPLALFHEHGFECFGIDISSEHLGRAQACCQERGLSIDLRQGDMRDIPFGDAEFDYVYEHYSMCHLTKTNTSRAVMEMRRVLKPGGLCFLGVISRDTWPLADYGEERKPGEFWGHEEGSGEELTLHSLFSDEEAEQLVEGWDVIGCEKRSVHLRDQAEQATPEEWMALHGEAKQATDEHEWRASFPRRAYHFNYTHLYYYLRKPL